jgi:hypothetical protein
MDLIYMRKFPLYRILEFYYFSQTDEIVIDRWMDGWMDE